MPSLKLSFMAAAALTAGSMIVSHGASAQMNPAPQNQTNIAPANPAPQPKVTTNQTQQPYGAQGQMNQYPTNPAQAQVSPSLMSPSRLAVPSNRRLTRTEMDAHEREITKDLNNQQLQRMLGNANSAYPTPMPGNQQTMAPNQMPTVGNDY